MAYAQRLINRILEAERVRGGSLASGKTYRDEPILRTGTNLVRQGDSAHGRPAHRAAASSPTDDAPTAFRKHSKNRVAGLEPPPEPGWRRSVSCFDPDEIGWPSRTHSTRRYMENDSAQMEFLRALKEDPDYNGSTPAKRAEAKRRINGKNRQAAEKGKPGKRRGKNSNPPTSAAAGQRGEPTESAPLAGENQPREFTVDLGRLAGIRAAAKRSCEALLTDEERFDVSETSKAKTIQTTEATNPNVACDGAVVRPTVEESAASGCAADTPSASDRRDSPFSPAEAAFLRCLIEHAPAAQRAHVAKEAGVPESMLMDAINEKALDLIGDIAVEQHGAQPEIVEDYIEKLRGLVA